MKMLPWVWGHWLLFSSSSVQCSRLSRVGERGFALTCALVRLSTKIITPFADHLGEKDIHFREV